MKLMVLPLLFFLFCYFYAIPPHDALPGIILLATPTATTSFILANELGGDTELASGVITPFDAPLAVCVCSGLTW